MQNAVFVRLHSGENLEVDVRFTPLGNNDEQAITARGLLLAALQGSPMVAKAEIGLKRENK